MQNSEVLACLLHHASTGIAAAASTGRSAPEILKGGLDNLGEAPFGWLFGKPSALYSTEPSADRVQWEGDKAPAASPPPPSTRVSEYAAYTTPDAADRKSVV